MPIDLAGPGDLNAFASSVVAFLVGVLALGGLVVLALARWRRFRDRALSADRASSRTAEDLRPGFAVLCGTVETEGDEPAVEIVIEQRGVERRTKKGAHVVWRESARRVLARPFYLARAGGDAVRVEPDERVFLVDTLAVRERAGATRTRAATLERGEACVVAGVLRRGRDPRAAGAGYRDVGEALVLAPPSGERMLVSVEPLAERYLRRAAFHRGAAVILGVLFAAIQVLALGSYYLSVLRGRVERVTVTEATSWTTLSKGRRIQHFALEFIHPATTDYVRVETSFDAYDAAGRAAGRGALLQVPIRYVPHTDIVQLGETPRLKLACAWLVVGALVFSVLGYTVRSEATLAWYERKRVVERERGRLRDA